MRLVLTVPPIAGLQLTIGELRPCFDSNESSPAKLLAWDVPAGARVHVRGYEAMRTLTGWPCDVVKGVVVVDDELFEARLAASYRFREYTGAAIARAATPSLVEAAWPVLRTAFESARPDWGADGTVVCLRDLVVPRP
jgi:hypothetical protein